ncbi:MAG: helix-turn-helix domain-containing protein [Gemmatimonadales bacterium]|jgi:excisionase family DNA binding protein|nr:helix-turn-helix domain-containing protein [Gemmatimonadota bacterium]MBT7692776.1 helix-turn-helix domain-containing protein [Gemmatimonadales bacterium]
MEPLLTPDEVCEILRVPKPTLYSWRYHREGPVATKVGRHLRYRQSDLGAWIEEQVERPHHE